MVECDDDQGKPELLRRGVFEDGRPILARLDYPEERRRLARRRSLRTVARWLLARYQAGRRRSGE
jgi:hypothetical protein